VCRNLGAIRFTSRLGSANNTRQLVTVRENDNAYATINSCSTFGNTYMLPDEAVLPGGWEHSIFTAKVAAAPERIPDAAQTHGSNPCSRLGGRLQSMPPF